jgi:endo-alpha-1,4-polygalactosaminidase (GH114 family)
MKTQSQLQKAVAYWEANKADLLRDHSGKNALISNGELSGIYNDFVDAYKIGLDKFGEGQFLVKTIEAKSINLGFIGMSLANSQALSAS